MSDKLMWADFSIVSLAEKSALIELSKVLFGKIKFLLARSML